MGEIFHVTTDYLLKPSELDELAMKTEMLEKGSGKFWKMKKRGRKSNTAFASVPVSTSSLLRYLCLSGRCPGSMMSCGIFSPALRCRSFYCSLPPRRQFLSVSGGSKGAGGWNHNRKLMRKKVREGLRQLLRRELTDTKYQYFYKSPSNPGIGSNIIEEQR